MAQRKKPQTEFVPDSSEANNAVLVTHMLGDNDFNRYVKMCFHGTASTVEQLKKTAEIHLERIGVKPNPSKGVAACPEASANYNPQSLFAWMETLDKSYKRAVAQLVTLHATACRRLGA